MRVKKHERTLKPPDADGFAKGDRRAEPFAAPTPISLLIPAVSVAYVDQSDAFR
jgi:hypothetical protein